MELKIRLAPRAAADLARIRDHSVECNPMNADDVRLAINAVLARLTENPHLGRERLDLDAYAIVVRPYPFMIYYRIHEGEIVVVHFRDSRRQPLAQLG